MYLQGRNILAKDMHPSHSQPLIYTCPNLYSLQVVLKSFTRQQKQTALAAILAPLMSLAKLSLTLGSLGTLGFEDVFTEF